MFTKKFWRKGTGSELICAALTFLGMILFVSIIVLSYRYAAAIRAQTIADTIADGAVAYAQNDMNIAEEPFTLMADKLFRTNKDLYEDRGILQISNLKTGLSLAVEHPEYYSSAEWKYIKDRAEIMKGTISTFHFKFAGHFPPYNVSYNGPKFMDQIATVSVDCTFNIPFSNLAEHTGTAVTMTLAKDPYNARADKKAEPALYSDLCELEKIAYAEALSSEDSESNLSDTPMHGSLTQMVLLEARRYLGDGYSRDERINPLSAKYPIVWPQVTKNGIPLRSDVYTNEENSYKDCYHFVDSCFFKVGGLNGALSQYPHTYINRRVDYQRIISAHDIWKDMHEGKLVKSTAFETDENLLVGYCKQIGRPYYVKNNTYYFQFAGKKSINSYPAEDGYTIQYWTGRKGVNIRKKQTLEQAREMYAGDITPAQCWSVQQADRFIMDDLKIGDIIIFSNPNWNKLIYQELDAIGNAASAYDPILDKLDNGEYQTKVCHYAIYIGNGRVVECTSKKAPGAANNGPQINPVYGVTWDQDPDNTILITRIIRFSDQLDSSAAETIEEIPYTEGIDY